MPPNCVWLYDSLWIDKTEIANIHWLEYLYYLEKDSAKEVLMKALPDETVWMDYDKTEKKQKITCARPTFVTTRWWGLVMSKRPNIVVGDQQG